MQGIKQINANPAEQHVSAFLAAANAYAEQQRKSGLGEYAEFVSARNAKELYAKLVRTSMAIADPSHAKHATATNAMREQFGRKSDATEYLASLGQKFRRESRELAEAFVKNGMAPGDAVAQALNSIAGNPVYDHFSNLNLLAGQLYQEMSFLESFTERGDAVAVPLEPGGTGLDLSRFRAPTEEVVGSAKPVQGNINSDGNLDYDNSRTQINLYNEFKNAFTIAQVFSITDAMRDQALGYENAVSPALAGFILQNRYFGAAQKQVLKLAELAFVGGQNAAGNYVKNVGGSYGILSSAIQLTLADAAANAPVVASTADWQANPTKLIQKIKNAFYKMPTVSQQLDPSINPLYMYQDIVRLFQLAAQQNVNFVPREWVLYVPSSWYGVAMQYPASAGTFNKQLQEMVSTATGGVINKIMIVPSSLVNYNANIGNGHVNSYNYMVAVAQGCPSENKPIILPGQTALPVVTSDSVTPAIMNFRSQFITGGPMVLQYGGAFILEFSVAA